MYAQYLNSSSSVGGWFIAADEETAIAMAKAALEARFPDMPGTQRLDRHPLGGGREVTPAEVSWAMGRGRLDKRPIAYVDPALGLTAADTSRGSGGWDFTNLVGL